MVDRQENLLNSRRSRIAKIVTFLPWDNLLILPALKLFFSFFYATQKVGRTMPPSARQNGRSCFQADNSGTLRQIS